MTDDPELRTAADVVRWLPSSIRDELTWCPARRACGHVFAETDREEIHNMDGRVRVIVTESCECGARR